MSGEVFVTVGTTRFEALIKAADSHAVAEALSRHGYRRLIMQIGTGTYKPQRLVPSGTCAQHPSGLEITFFDFLPTLKQQMAAADLVISHAGSGSIFEALVMRKPLIAVPNPILMHNHQAQLVEHLAGMKHCIPATVDTLSKVLSNLQLGQLQPYMSGDSRGIFSRIDDIVTC
ncbi:hypothetical protein WJX74_009742 [Apatococcus lobatus]|uniref:Glycosyl transferase family 28 C-terminal domain-containing protein n=1 Tax=Apatococcus lobatus TaxID=904363 RepID=A0AAW1QIR8_9CHLO